jgi:hypothetical protein
MFGWGRSLRAGCELLGQVEWHSSVPVNGPAVGRKQPVRRSLHPSGGAEASGSTLETNPWTDRKKQS